MTEQIDLDKLKERFDTDGFAIVPGFLSQSDLTAMISEINLHYGSSARGETKGEDFDQFATEVIPWDPVAGGNAFFAALLASSNLDRITSGCVGAGYAGTQSLVMLSPPGGKGQAWHQDEIYIPTRDRSLIGAWIALDDATIENGCLWVVPGSHRTGHLYPQRQHDNTDEFDFGTQSYGFDESLEVPVEVKTGSVVFFNGYLLHRSQKNRSNIYRRVLVNHYMNAWSLLPWEVSEGGTAALADCRRVVPVAGVDPYSWKGIDAPIKNVWLRTAKAVEENSRTRETAALK